MKKTILASLTLCLAFMLAFVSCEKEPTSMTLPSSTAIYVDSTATLSVTLVPETYKGNINWTSSNPAIATVSSEGVITGIAAGTCVVTANIGNSVAATQVTVLNNPVELELTILSTEQKKCTVRVEASYEEGYYYCGYIDKATLGTHTDAELKASVISYINSMLKTYAAYGITLTSLLQKGSGNLVTSGLTANTEYVMFAFGIDATTGRVSPEMAKADFTTKQIVPSDIVITMAFDSVAIDTVKSTGKVNRKVYFKATPSNNDPYVFNGTTAQMMDSLYQNSDSVFFASFEAYYDKNYSSYGGCDYVAKTGERDIYFTNPVDGQTLVLMAAGYKGGFTSQIYHFEYTYHQSAPSAPARLVCKQKIVQAEEVVKMPFSPMLKNSCYKIQ